ncbi:hypothetical protein H6G20_09330 [Desertifilum sp. FACHB-1129]|uniref:Uncharacterized protein n=2 Tax=Desertifilum tharense IPPAS B-1220 TaxID=1781255 RepID=A0A1E5QQF6_9CYAN|nr:MULTISPECIES: hypothetical protein [Desertifilum]MDA0209205.1 hypothetical protein [Cyanobacteria bacterium FC1]MDI9639134.1 hypothetical protein [Geitlerinema splendidum]MDK3157294.1 hypothetical protein [Kamptonema cortianum]MBD2311859.1 hypothetical protein [Desertifilum sp. FACHB-1129]MBD2323003.1 hypothetical protein [Desertifilum sp. FACHB-866]
MTEQLSTSPNRLSAATLQLIQNRPFLVWISGLTLMVSVAAIAGTGLLSPGPIEEETQTTEAIAPPAPAAIGRPNPQVQTPDLPWWFFGGLALGCMGGSWLIARYLLSSSPRSPQPQPQRRPPTRNPVSPPQETHAKVEPVVTVMPAEEIHPLDGTEDLAEIMDIRKRKSLSAVLRGY